MTDPIYPIYCRYNPPLTDKADARNSRPYENDADISVTQSVVTFSIPPSVRPSRTSPRSVSIEKSHGRTVVTSGIWPAMTARSPSAALRERFTASPSKKQLSGEITFNLKVFKIWFSLLFQPPRRLTRRTGMRTPEYCHAFLRRSP